MMPHANRLIKPKMEEKAKRGCLFPEGERRMREGKEKDEGGRRRMREGKEAFKHWRDENLLRKQC